MIRVAIVDDQEIMIARTKKEVEKALFKLEEEFEISVFLSGEKYIASLDDISYDIVFLDIEMPDANGLALSKATHMKSSHTSIIFVTSHDELMEDSFGLNVYAFIKKEDIEAKVEKTLLSLVKDRGNEKSIVLKTEEGLVRYTIADIIAFTLEDRRIYMYLSNGAKVKVSGTTLLDMKNMIQDDVFDFVNRSAYVNLRYVESTKDLVATIIGRKDLAFDISENRKSDVNKKFMNLLLGV